jgi:hypothetical protein
MAALQSVVAALNAMGAEASWFPWHLAPRTISPPVCSNVRGRIPFDPRAWRVVRRRRASGRS